MKKTEETGSLNLVVDPNPSPEDVQAVRDRLDAFNRQHVEEDHYQPLAIFVRDSQGAIAGGLTGNTYWGWLNIEILWLRDDLRGQGYGQQLVAAAEAEALRRGCRHVHVDTMDFQAPAFYRKLGYSEWGVLNDLPAGHRRIFFRKDLG